MGMTTPPITVALDVDNVLAATSETWIDRVNARHQLTLDVTQWTEWDLEAIYPKDVAQVIYDELKEEDFYDTIQPRLGALEAVTRLRAAGLRCLFVTCELADHRFAGRKWTWLQRHGFADTTHRRDYLETLDKSIVRAELIVDDNITNVTGFTGGGVLMTRPWNAHFECTGTAVARASDWDEALMALARRIPIMPRPEKARSR
jgi:5'(3')-deoxyribonucleotidase